MNEPAERVAVACPACSPAAETVHEVLSSGGGGHATVRCADCGHTHKIEVSDPERVDLDVVVSQEGDSITAQTAREPDEPLAVGDEFIVDVPEAIMQVRITSLEVGEEARAEEALASDVRTVWTRAVDNVRVPVTVHGSGDRDRGGSRSLTLSVPGDEAFTVGEVRSVGDETFEIEGIQVRDEVDYRFDKLDHEGDQVFAKDVKRLYARDETTTAWSAW